MEIQQGAIMPTLTYTQLERGPLTLVTEQSIAPNPPDFAEAIVESDGVRFYVAGAKPWAACCWKASRPLLPPGGPLTVTLAWEEMLDDSPSLNSRELDLMVSDDKGNVYNGSEHLLIATGGVEIVNAAGAWIAIPFLPGVPAPGLWTAYSVTMAIDPSKGASAVTDTSAGPKKATLMPLWIPALKLGWTPPLAGLWQAVAQVQPGLVQAGGACSVKVRNLTVTATWS
jgi:hypothetical protein